MVDFKICDCCLKEIPGQSIKYIKYVNGQEYRYDFCNVECLLEFMEKQVNE